MLNVGINQTCMAFETDYAGCLAPGQAHDTFISAMKEVIRIADAEGVNLTEDAIGEYIEIVRSLKPDSIPSMRQDSLQKRRTEVDMFAGTVIRIAEKHGISVPGPTNFSTAERRRSRHRITNSIFTTEMKQECRGAERSIK